MNEMFFGKKSHWSATHTHKLDEKTLLFSLYLYVLMMCLVRSIMFQNNNFSSIRIQKRKRKNERKGCFYGCLFYNDTVKQQLTSFQVSLEFLFVWLEFQQTHTMIACVCVNHVNTNRHPAYIPE